MKASYGHTPLPCHVGIIMDGNRRWAKKRFLPSVKGHANGAEVLKSISLYCNKIGLKYLTVYAFSTENWKRSEEEVGGLMRLFKKYLKDVISEIFKLENIKIEFIGNISVLPLEIKELISKIEKESSKNTGMTLTIAFNYGGREEIRSAVESLVQDTVSGKIALQDISEMELSKRMYAPGHPDIDLIIRTAGEQRISNFMLWESAYAEFYFTDVLWPDFNEAELHKAFEEYSSRTRRFGGV